MSEKLTIEERSQALLEGVLQRAEVPVHEWGWIRDEALAHLRAVDAAARAEERERCALIADSMVITHGVAAQTPHENEVAQIIAAAIREGSDD